MEKAGESRMHRMDRRSRNLLALVVAVLGACASGGCIYIPTFGASEGENVSRFVGAADSKRTLRLGLSTRHDVIALLGGPTAASDESVLISHAPQDSHTLIYRWQTLQGYGGMLIGPCSGLGWFKDYRSLTFQFNDGGVIDRIKQE
jgi:hypothetical protein